MTICGYFRHQSPNKLVSQLDDPISTKLFMVPGGQEHLSLGPAQFAKVWLKEGREIQI